jgi:hypothetical protein
MIVLQTKTTHLSCVCSSHYSLSAFEANLIDYHPVCAGVGFQYEDWLKKGWLKKIGCVHMFVTNLYAAFWN